MTIETDVTDPLEPRAVRPALARGARGRCPACGTGAIFGRYLEVNDTCPGCGEALHHHRADDAPPYAVILVVGHVIVGAALALEVAFHPPTRVHLALWLPLTVVLALALLPVAKGALIGLQWALRMHGFGGEADATAVLGAGP